LQSALDALRARGDIDADRIGLWGVSKGAELALAAASRIDGFAAVVAIVPSDVIWEGWGLNDGTRPSSFAWRGQPLDYVPYLGMGAEFSKYGRDQKVAIRTPHDAGRLANPDRIAAARIGVENIDEPVFLVGGDSDETWDSGGMARNIKEARDEAGLETVLFVDKRAGHFLSGDAYTPIREKANANMRRETFPAMLEFLEAHLKGGAP
ncbi:MAG: acyl-CoA thioester hydrolase/BAAT C-terminal domain-containing protein, partial [Planctomycetota bacterium]